MPLTMPKLARGLAIAGFSARRFGTIRFSVVLIPERRTSAIASGAAACTSRPPMGKASPIPARSRIRRKIRQPNVRQPPRLLPRITLRQARTGFSPPQTVRAAMVIPMEQSCSATSTAASVPMRLAAVKYPVITEHRQLTGRNAASSRRAGAVSVFPIQLSASFGAAK